MHIINQYFDNVYVLNVDSRKDRKTLIEKRLKFAGIEYERFNAILGQSVEFFFKNTQFKIGDSFEGWPSANTVACNLSHISIYNQALARGENRILILEDDIRIHKNIDAIFTQRLKEFETHGIEPDLLYLCYIPISEDGKFWNFGLLNHLNEERTIFPARHLWSLMAYGINGNLMQHMSDTYADSFPMEIDRYLVTNIQTSSNYLCVGISPSLMSGDNLGSDNLPASSQVNYIERTVDTRFANYWDYV